MRIQDFARGTPHGNPDRKDGFMFMSSVYYFGLHISGLCFYFLISGLFCFLFHSSSGGFV